MKNILIIPAFFFSTFAIAQKNKDAAKFAKTITQKDLKDQLTIVASAEMEGRETATPGQKRAAAYIESQFKEFGLLPGNGNSFQQIYPVYQDELKSASLDLYNLNFAYDKDFTVNLSSAVSGTFNINEVVFVGYGNSDKEKDDYKNVTVKGKWVMLIEATAADIDKDENASSSNPRAVFAKINAATKNGAIGVIVVSKNFQKTNRQPLQRKGSMYMKKQTTENAVPVISVSYQAAASMLTKFLNSYSALKNIAQGNYATNIKLSIDKTTNNLESSNVIALLEGSDKKDEYIILTGHYDHLGKRDSIFYYGADDDGSGTVSVIEMAQAFAEAKKKGKGPRRNILFMTVSGEEKGLWGSEYYTMHPTVPLNKISVNLNTDMVGRIDPLYKGDSMNYVYAIGEDKLSSELIKITDSINKTAKLEIDRRFNDPKDPNRFYYRSDHYNFAKNGVPIIFYFDGVHKDYHRSTDTVEKINFDLVEKRVHLIFNTAWIMANRNEMIKRDLPLNVGTR